MAVARGSALLQCGRGAAPAPAGLGRLCSFTSVAASRSGRAAVLRNMSQSFAAGSRKYSETVNVDSLCWTPPINSHKPSVCIENIPSEMLIKVFSYLDAVSLLHVACVNKRFYQLASDNGIWLKIYFSCFPAKRRIWKNEFLRMETVPSSCAVVEDRKPGYWKKEYILKQIAAVKTRVMQLVKPVDPCTGLPCKNQNAIKASGLSWIIVLKDKNGKEYVMEKAHLSFKHTSVSIFWYGTGWPCLDVLSTLKLFGVIPLLPGQSAASSKNSPRRRSLIAEYSLSHLTESSVTVGSDNLVQLFSLNPGLVVGLWKESNEIAFVMVSLHYHQLLERSALGSATVQYVLQPDKPVLDDIDPEYGLHDYDLHLDMHGGKHTYMCGTFKSLFCRKVQWHQLFAQVDVLAYSYNIRDLLVQPGVGNLLWQRGWTRSLEHPYDSVIVRFFSDSLETCFCRILLKQTVGDIENGYLKLTVVSLKDNAKHIPLIGTVGLSWETTAFKGIVKDCYMMDVTVLDETQKPFWCFSAPVCMELSSKVSNLYDYMGHIYTTVYADSEGKVCAELVWLEETKEYFIVSLVLYISTEKVNNWYGTKY